MVGRVVIFGYGPTGRATAERLLAEGREVIVAQRHAPASLPKGATFVACDALDRDAVIATARQGEQFVVAIGFAYHREIWRQAWPKAIGNFVAACEATGARMVFVDNLYMYGPQTNPLVETMTSSKRLHFASKPMARVQATRIWTEACDQGRARVAALRAPDFYGPNVGLGYLGDPTIGRMAQGKRATVLGSADIPHDYAYVPDIGRAVATLLAAPELGLRTGVARSLRPDPDHPPDPADRGRRARRQAEAHCLAGIRGRGARIGDLPAPRAKRDALHLRPAVSGRLEQIRQDVLVRPDAVRGGGQKDGAGVPGGVRDRLNALRGQGRSIAMSRPSSPAGEAARGAERDRHARLTAWRRFALEIVADPERLMKMQRTVQPSQPVRVDHLDRENRRQGRNLRGRDAHWSSFLARFNRG